MTASNDPSSHSPLTAQARLVAFRAILITLAGLVAYGAYTGYVASQTMVWQSLTLMGVLAFSAVLALASLVLVRLGRVVLAIWLTVAGLLISLVAAGSLLSGIGLALLFIAPVLTGTLVARVLTSRGRAVALVIAGL